MKIILTFIILLSANSAFSQSLSENLEWNKQFKAESVQGVFVLCKGSAKACVTNDKDRAITAFIPASTFKIPNALISLETGVIKDEHQVFKWDGKPRVMKQWQQDLTLRGAIQVSAVPVFQQFAREVGEKRMREYLNKLSYGNADIGGGIDQFWLTGKLRVSAQQQVEFLESLYLNKLPFSKVNQLIVKEALVTETTPEYIVHSKTGLSGFGTKAKPGITWWVGWIEKGTEVYFFAFNMDISSETQLPARKFIPTKIMLNEGILVGG